MLIRNAIAKAGQTLVTTAKQANTAWNNSMMKDCVTSTYQGAQLGLPFGAVAAPFAFFGAMDSKKDAKTNIGAGIKSAAATVAVCTAVPALLNGGILLSIPAALGVMVANCVTEFDKQPDASSATQPNKP